ncbi:hypothetical protein SPV66_ORF025 [Staphylococcus phage 66]|uniref:ORF025 n=1 Tax=Staphylococcus phage 66 TaxID=320832 RepID=Q4ZE39_9CAUD|nr:hypothetical protein SPV66_ORF025 [Staphylococcus phage 66]AAX90670.1 ORF025 [Staphylococcus phage 66]
MENETKNIELKHVFRFKNGSLCIALFDTTENEISFYDVDIDEIEDLNHNSVLRVISTLLGSDNNG